MYFVVSAGGTAGHINPALAVADELRSRGHKILFVGTPDHIEARLAREAGFEFVGLTVAGFDKAHPLTLVSSGAKIMKATSQVKKRFQAERPDAVLTFGAYVSIPVGRAAAALGIPLVVHEQNSVPGMANKFLAKKAQVMALTYAESAAQLESAVKPVVLGNPVRKSFEGASREAGRKAFGIPQDALMLLVMGGSLGAQHINTALAAMKERLLAIPKLYIVHSAGQNDYDAVVKQLALTGEQQQRWQLHAYIDNMDDCLAAADLVVSRAGASSLAEIMTVGAPSVLVPYPYARGDHQTLNAQGCVAVGASAFVPDAEVEGAAFADLVIELLGNEDRRSQMRAACAGLSGSNARIKLADLAEEAARGNQR